MSTIQVEVTLCETRCMLNSLLLPWVLLNHIQLSLFTALVKQEQYKPRTAVGYACWLSLRTGWTSQMETQDGLLSFWILATNVIWSISHTGDVARGFQETGVNYLFPQRHFKCDSLQQQNTTYSHRHPCIINGLGLVLWEIQCLTLIWRRRFRAYRYRT